MKKQFNIFLIAMALLLVNQSLSAQWTWGKQDDLERIDTVVSIPKRNSNSIFINDNDFYLRMGFLGINLEIEDDWDSDWRSSRNRPRNFEYIEQHDHGTLKSLDFEIGFNNYLNKGNFPSSSDLYQVKPLGSVYVGLNWNHTTYVSGPLYLDWGGGFSWYNYKFENAATRLDPNGGQLNFVEETNVGSALKSKLKVSYLNVKAVPMFDFSRGKRIVRKYEEDDVRVAFSRKTGFRIGVGPYAGLRLGNKAKYIDRTNGDRDKVKSKGGFFVNDFRYGARLQIGINGFDMFMTYDFNELFENGKGPELNPITIGVTF
ncbi:hypothetical protein AWW67_01010 [Roseivirga seohaensis]|uniref:Outer membrane protein beta-barrel domain-containing protein n=1 Tax=Roseivirga seohaensis TaxID=1914963 RepID=A0A150Y4H3_9BACT|nr:hypothetical protein [Roseivirga seohaensis]KYG85846.1 hypothetical protein AWW67_01010 [Roseivirga seohaensis]